MWLTARVNYIIWCQGSVAADIGEIVRGDEPQLDSISLPWCDTGRESRERRAAFRGAMLLNCTRERQPTNPGVLYFSITTGSMGPVSARREEKISSQKHFISEPEVIMCKSFKHHNMVHQLSHDCEGLWTDIVPTWSQHALQPTNLVAPDVFCILIFCSSWM